MLPFLKSLEEIEDGVPKRKNGTHGKVEVRIFTVPDGKQKIPFTRVNHAKYMVTEEIAYIGEQFYFFISLKKMSENSSNEIKIKNSN